VSHPTSVAAKEVDMAKVIHCDCGFVVRGDTDDEIVAAAQSHARDSHGMEITREQVLTMAQPA
jgi:predicted small metal-binding protein